MADGRVRGRDRRVRSSRAAQGPDDLVVEEAVEPVAAGNFEIRMAQQSVIDQVDNMVFNRLGGSAMARTRFDAALAMRIEELERTCGLTENQKKKLKLAGRGDIKRVFDRVEEAKRKFQRNWNDPNNNIWEAIQPLQVEINAGLFKEDSLFQKTIKNTLNSEQAARYDSLMRERNLTRYRATVEWFVVTLDRFLGFNDDQRRRLAELIVNDTEPPRRFGQSDYWYLLYQVSRLPDDKLKPIFDVPQWRLLSRQLPQARGMEHWLKTSGVLADAKRPGGNAATAPAAVPGILGRPVDPAERALIRLKRAIIQEKKQD